MPRSWDRAEWTTEIYFLHLETHSEYAKMVSWQMTHSALEELGGPFWTCDEACLANFEPEPLHPPRLIYKEEKKEGTSPREHRSGEASSG